MRKLIVQTIVSAIAQRATTRRLYWKEDNLSTRRLLINAFPE
jgi:hypothetical protein